MALFEGSSLHENQITLLIVSWREGLAEGGVAIHWHARSSIRVYDREVIDCVGSVGLLYQGDDLFTN